MAEAADSAPAVGGTNEKFEPPAMPTPQVTSSTLSAEDAAKFLVELRELLGGVPPYWAVFVFGWQICCSFPRVPTRFAPHSMHALAAAPPSCAHITDASTDAISITRLHKNDCPARQRRYRAIRTHSASVPRGHWSVFPELSTTTNKK